LAAYVLVTGSLAFLVFLRALPGVDVSMPIKPTGYWQLPTGSKIAYLRVPARGGAAGNASDPDTRRTRHS
jgi:hypothetical protein